MGEKRSDEPTLAKCERLRVVLNVAQLSHPGAVSAWSPLLRLAHFNTLQHGAHISCVSKKGTKLTPKRLSPRIMTPRVERSMFVYTNGRHSILRTELLSGTGKDDST